MISCLAALWLSGCDSSTEPKETVPGFLFRVEVTDSAGKPMQNLRLSGYNEITGIDPARLLAANTRPAPSAVATAMFAVAETTHVTFEVLDLNRRLVDRLIDRVLKPGLYTTIWNTGPETANGIYEFSVAARDTLTGTIIFENAVYSMKWNVDPEMSVYGYTKADGVYETANQLLFPNTLRERPTLIHTGLIGDSLGIIEFEETVMLTVADTATGDWMRLREPVRPGRNIYSIEWTPGANSGSKTPDTPRPPAGSDTHRDIDPPELIWKLLYPFPNPFN